jgi:hypothetical protein
MSDGYQVGVDLFVFAYDWRLDNSITAGLLRRYIDEFVVPASGSAIVDIVAHSMGGLVTRKYAALYNDARLNKVIYLGTPHGGSPKAFNVLALDDSLATKFFTFPASWFVNAQTMARLSRTFPSVYQLLPQSTPFVRHEALGMLSLSETYQLGFNLASQGPLVANAATFVASLASAVGVRDYNVVGSGIATLNGLTLKSPPGILPGTWCGAFGNGDDTVTIESATQQLADTIYLRKVKHDRLPNSALAADVIMRILHDDVLSIPAEAAFIPFSPGVTLGWCTGSPIRVSATDQEGRVTGRTSDGAVREQIPESSFFAFGHNESGVLPADGPHQFSIVATGAGVFDLTLDRRAEDGSVLNTTRFVDVPIGVGWKGKLTVGLTEPVLEMDADGDGATDFVVLPGSGVAPETSLAMLQRVIETAGLNSTLSKALVVQVRVAGTLVRRNKPGAAIVLRAIAAEVTLLSRGPRKLFTAEFAAAVDAIIDGILLTLR